MGTPSDAHESEHVERPACRLYKRRFFGMVELMLLNFVVSWDWLAFSTISTTASQYYDVSESAINWMSTGFMFAFCIASPVAVWTLKHGGPRAGTITTAVLIIVGNWIRYAGSKANGGIYGVALFGQLVIGLAQPFCLCVATSYSDLWFSDRQRTSATALISLANPLGGAVGQIVDSVIATEPSDIPNLVLYISIISTVASIPAFFVPARPPTPASLAPSPRDISDFAELKKILETVEFWLILVAFSVYVGTFSSISSLLNQVIAPYGFSELEAGIAGVILIVAGLVTAAITSPWIDRYKKYLGMIRVFTPVVALSYVGLIFAPPSIAAFYVVMILVGATSFALLPIYLELLVELTYPISPEMGNTFCWLGGQLLGACILLIQTALRAGPTANPPFHMRNALIFSAVISMVAMPLPMSLGLWRRVDLRRQSAEKMSRDAPSTPESNLRQGHMAA